MLVEITDYLRGEAYYRFEGEPAQVEEHIRQTYGDNLEHVPVGDIYECVRTLGRMAGIELHVEGLPERPPFVATGVSQSTASVDPWLRESDFRS